MTVGHDRDEVEEILASMRAAGDAIAAARAEFASVTFGEKILYGTRSKLCMALGLGTDASGITIVDAVRAVIRERDEARAEAEAAQRGQGRVRRRRAKKGETTVESASAESEATGEQLTLAGEAAGE